MTYRTEPPSPDSDDPIPSGPLTPFLRLPVIVERLATGQFLITPAEYVSVAEIEAEGRRTAAARRTEAYRESHPEYVIRDRERTRLRMAALRAAQRRRTA